MRTLLFIECLANSEARRGLIDPEHYPRAKLNSCLKYMFFQLKENHPGLRQAQKFVTLKENKSQMQIQLEEEEIRI